MCVREKELLNVNRTVTPRHRKYVERMHAKKASMQSSITESASDFSSCDYVGQKENGTVLNIQTRRRS